MHFKFGAASAAFCLVYCSVASAQSTNASAVAPASASLASATAPAVTTIITPAAASILRAGLPIPLKTSEPLTTEGKKLRVGQRMQLEVAEPVMLNGQVVIPAGSPAIGEITDVRNKGMWGKSGRINARVLFVRANGRQIRLTGQFDDKGVTGTAGVVAAIALIPIAGFITTGTSAKIPLGAPVKAFLDEDLEVALAPAATPAPTIVPTAPAAAAPTAAGSAITASK